ncbi:putative indole-3-acetic acid-amido synthetase GH3.5 [Capsicum annuum]|uniref:indole-3-acetic acid-amido synthetase GH3.10 n=1 Tax=Capsicum annuum TaxID=4072 RepID=UPI001FB15EB0|nr:indole-3-acetic acid-amido synthetase GH3.10 [Capsicum annuum]KAF3652031.1 putative indole-3-acetic acid-amido synthetase GH3.5 [Capsicum annuum]
MDSAADNKSNNNNYFYCKGNDEIISWFDRSAENAAAIQRQTLRRILELNHRVEYLNKWIGDIRLIQDENALESLYATMVPLASHADFEPYIHKIADGEKAPLLTQEPITTLSLSSGTTEGSQKFVPFTHHSSQTTLQIFKLAAAYRSRIYSIREGGKVLEFIYSSKQYKTKGGLIAGTATTHYYASEEFKIKQQHTKSFTCSPEEVISSGDYKQSTYCHLLLGLYFSEEVEFVTSTFAYSIVQAFRSFEELWKELCHDIREGTLSSRINIIKVRKTVLGIIVPHSELASRIESICEELEREDWFSIIPRLWPNVKYVYSIMTGSMQPYLNKLRHYAGNLPLVSADYGSTESWIGVNVEPSSPPEKVTFAVIPTFSYFEFIPLHRSKPQSCNNNHKDANLLVNDDFIEDDPVPLSQVKIGQEYEIILTTFTGLYRYRLGDVVEVIGFHKKTPKLNFICRRKLILTVNIDKNTEKDLQLVVERGSQILLSKSRAELVDFTSHANVAKRPGHYVIYWEIKGDVEEKVLGECCREMDASFVDHGYVVSRKTNSIGPLELCIVERGTFKKILEHFIGNGAALSQFKTPRCTSNQVLLRILNVCTMKRFYSTAYG